MLKIYSFLTTLLSFVVLPLIFVIRLIQNKDVSSWRVKLGNYKLPVDFDTKKKTIMIHGVSVGEVISLQKLIRKTKETFPNANLVVTTGTNTGYETALKKLSDTTDFITYFPIDTKSSVDKFLDKISPDIILIAETEIWPNFAIECSKRNIPLFIINGRMSDESFKSYKLLKFFFKEILPLYSGIFVQSDLDKQRMITAGAIKDKVEVMKNLKFDIEKINCNIDLNSGNSKILIAGSTHKGEDEIVLSAYDRLRIKNPDLKLLLAPRHITRIDDVKNLLKGYKFNLYSKKPSFEDADIILLDVMGELAKLYSCADVAFIGGSFNKTGGHNPLEAVIFSKPVISGPSIKNFRDIYYILTVNGAGFVVKNEEDFFHTTSKLLLDEDFYNKTVQNSNNVFNNQQGALDFVIEKIKGVLS